MSGPCPACYQPPSVQETPAGAIRNALQIWMGCEFGWNPEADELVVTREDYEAVVRLLRHALTQLESPK